MIRIVIQNKPSSNFIPQVRLLHNALSISWFKAIKYAIKLKRNYGLVISTPATIEERYMFTMLGHLHSLLKHDFDADWSSSVEPINMIPADTFDLILTRAGYRVYLSNKPGYIDSWLTIY